MVVAHRSTTITTVQAVRATAVQATQVEAGAVSAATVAVAADAAAEAVAVVDGVEPPFDGVPSAINTLSQQQTINEISYSL